MRKKTRNRSDERDHAKVESNTTSMIDVTFLLLIFFMCTLRFRVLEGKLAAYLPRDVGSGSESVVQQEPIDIRLAVVDEGRRLVAGASEPFVPGSGRRFEYGPDRRTRVTIGLDRFDGADVHAVYERLCELREQDRERAVVIDAGPGIATDEVVRVLDQVAAAGLVDVRFRATEPSH